MKTFGFILLCLGTIVMFFGIVMSIVPPGMQTINFGLMSEKICTILVAGFTLIIGAIFMASNENARPNVSSQYHRERERAIICEAVGDIEAAKKHNAAAYYYLEEKQYGKMSNNDAIDQQLLLKNWFKKYNIEIPSFK